MQLWIGVHLPHLALEAFLPRWSTPRHEAGFVVLEKDRVVALDRAALSAGIVAGMRRGGVLTLAPGAVIRERDLTREAELVRGVAFALLHFTPHVVLAEEAVVLADVSASLRLFGGIRPLRRLARETVIAFGVTATLAVAPTGQAAWLFARSSGGIALTLRSVDRALRRVPLPALPPARPYAEWFDGLGCETVDDVRRLPRAGLKKRCGTALLDALDRATGAAPEVYEWLEMPPAFSARLELPDRIEHAEAVLFAARRLILQMTGWLSARHLAIARFVLELEHERGRAAVPPTAIEAALAEPTSREDHLVRLLKERLGRVELAAPGIAVRLDAKDVREADAPSESLFPEPGGSPQDHARLMELLVARLGAQNVTRAAPVADHRPEVAARWLPVGETVRSMPPPSGLPRPTWLLDSPVQLIMRGHRPFYGTPLRMVSPAERIEGGWQDGHLVTRDYFVAESGDAVHYWVFRECTGARDDREPRWFLHGLFG